MTKTLITNCTTIEEVKKVFDMFPEVECVFWQGDKK